MPIKPFKQIQLRPEQPDCCNECPLLGLIPEAEREFGSQETLVCLGTRHALNARIARSRKSEHTPKHPLKQSGCSGRSCICLNGLIGIIEKL